MVGNLRFGIVDAIATDLNNVLHAAMRAFMATAHDVRFEVRQSAPQELQEHLLKGALDLAIGSFPHKVAGLTYRPLYQEGHSLFCGLAHHLFNAPAADLHIARTCKSAAARSSPSASGRSLTRSQTVGCVSGVLTKGNSSAPVTFAR